jgi:tetratricopeptide (TPR) repeat protein
MLRLGQAAKSPMERCQGAGMLAAHATADGDLSEAKRLIFESRAAALEVGGNSNSNDRFAIQMYMVRLHQGRIGELEEAYRLAVDRFPSVIRQRIFLAFICAEAGRLDEAREQYTLLIADGALLLPQNYMWWMLTHCMARVAIRLGDRNGATALYETLLPYAHLNAIAANSISFGSASLVLGELAAMLERQDEATTHYETALSFNARTRQRTWATHTRLRYAELLLRRDVGEDASYAMQLLRLALPDANDIGMQKVAADCRALMVQAAGQPAGAE